MTLYQVQAQNFSDENENRMHSDAMAQKLGFESALVPGVAVYGHLTHPLVERFGAAWLGNSKVSLRLRKPAYHGDSLQIELKSNPDADIQNQVTCHARDTLLAEVDSRPRLPSEKANPPIDLLESTPKDPERVVIAWDNVVPQQPFRTWNWQITDEENQLYCDQVSDSQPIYKEYAHPHWLLSQANRALTREYVMPAWIHASSEITHYAPLMVGDDVVVQVLPLERWERKGHEFIKIYVAYTRGKEVTTEIEHTAIFKVADKVAE